MCHYDASTCSANQWNKSSKTKIFKNCIVVFNMTIYKDSLNLLKHSQYKNEATQWKNFLGLKIAAYFNFTVQVTEKGGNFKIKKFFNWIASFLYWLHFNTWNCKDNRTKMFWNIISKCIWHRRKFNFTGRNFRHITHKTFSLNYRAEYTRYPIDVTISNVQLETASSRNTGLGLANFVEQCICPRGYTGLSCEVTYQI